jgi:hypothetical protein
MTTCKIDTEEVRFRKSLGAYPGLLQNMIKARPHEPDLLKQYLEAVSDHEHDRVSDIIRNCEGNEKLDDETIMEMLDTEEKYTNELLVHPLDIAMGDMHKDPAVKQNYSQVRRVVAAAALVDMVKAAKLAAALHGVLPEVIEQA